MRKSSVLLALFASLSVYGWSADKEIIVESFEDGLNVESFRIVDGKWNVSSTKSQAEGVKATKTRYNDADANEGTVRFEPDFPVEGKYEVFITYPSSGNAKDVVHRIVSADGTKEEKLTQNGREFGNVPAANSWHSLGVHTFKAGKGGYVEVADPKTSEKPLAAENGRIYVDAVKFVPQGFELPADYVNKTGGAPAEGAAAPAPAPAPAATETAPAPAAPATDGLPNLPGSTPAATADGLPNLPNETPTSLDNLPSLPDASAPAAPATGTDGLPSLPGSTPAAAPADGLPSLPPAAPASTADGLPALPGSTPVATPAPSTDGLPTLPDTTPAATADGLPSLPPAGTPAADVAGLPSLPPASATTPAPAPTGLDGLPSLPPAGTEVAASPTPASDASSLPSLVPVTPTPVATLPSVSDTPAIGQGLPTFTPAPVASPAPVPTFGTTPPAPLPGSVPAFGTPATTDSGPASLQWTYDFGASLAAAKAADKLVLVFFSAAGNRAASTYENSYFQDPLVRKALDQFVLVKIDFPQNTRMAYNLSVFGAGIIAITDANGKVVGKIEQIPASSTELIQQMARIRNKALGTTPATPTPAPDASGAAASEVPATEETTQPL